LPVDAASLWADLVAIVAACRVAATRSVTAAPTSWMAVLDVKLAALVEELWGVDLG
jgi:hypothetical protein